MSAAIAPRTITLELTTEPAPAFYYGQQLSLHRGQGKITGLEYISKQTWEKYKADPTPPEQGWYYYVELIDARDPLICLSEAQLLQRSAEVL